MNEAELAMLTVDDPEGSRFKFLKPVLKTIPSQPFGGVFPSSRSARPHRLGTPKISWSRGLRRSPSIRRTDCIRTDWPISANASAKLLATVVFPSPGLALVITMMRGLLPFSPEYRIEVSVARNASAKREGFLFEVISSTCDGLPFSDFLLSRAFPSLVVSGELAPFCLC